MSRLPPSPGLRRDKSLDMTKGGTRALGYARDDGKATHLLHPRELGLSAENYREPLGQVR